MNIFFDKYLSKIGVFFHNNIKTHKDIFKALKTVFKFKRGCIYFLTPEILRLEYSYLAPDTKNEIQLSSTQKKELYDENSKIDLNLFHFSEKYSYAVRLKIENTIYGILVISSENKFNEEDLALFEFSGLIISNIIKDIELTKIIKLQTESLQKGLIKSDQTKKSIIKQNKAIIEADKIKSKFLSNVSHELRTPLNSIIGFAQLLENPNVGKLNKKQKECLKDIQTAGIHLLGMINEILDISKIESDTMKLNFSYFDISRCIYETLNILSPLIEKKLLTTKLDIESGNIYADYTKIQQILFNIINNAIKFSPEGASIDIITKFKRKYLEIRIKDYGCGIALKDQKRIFKKFEQIKTTQNSTGLGLTITKELIQMHQGQIKVISDIEKGAEFIIKLPISTI